MTKTLNFSDIHTGLRNAGYISALTIDVAVSGAIENTPLLVEGAPGVGKTCLAYAVAKMLDLPLIRVQFYEGLTPDKILYDYDYQRQLLTIETIKGVLDKDLEGKTVQEAIQAASRLDFYGKEFLIKRPILRAISGKEKCVLLLDEVEKASEELEYALLEVLENYSITIPQYGTIQCPEDKKPIVFLTSNNYRELSGALKRRCNYLYIEPKTAKEIQEILLLQADIDERTAKYIAKCMEKIRDLPLKQHPSVSEATRWAQYILQHKDELEKSGVEPTYCMIAKDASDAEQIKAALANERNIL